MKKYEVHYINVKAMRKLPAFMIVGKDFKETTIVMAESEREAMAKVSNTVGYWTTKAVEIG